MAKMYPAWSPDGSRIAFASKHGENYDIYVMCGRFQANQTDARLWTISSNWSPDGSRIAFASRRDSTLLNSQIYVMNADGSGQTRLTRDGGLDWLPSWSPDGRGIAFASIRDRDTRNERGRLRPDSTDEASWAYPSWSPAARIDRLRLGRQPRLHLCPSRPQRQDRVLSRRDGNRDIYAMNADGSGSRLTDNPADDQSPSWSPDGSASCSSRIATETMISTR